MKTRTTSPIDPDCGMFWKSDRERMLCYSFNTACDRHGFILGNFVSPGNVHDSKNFEHLFKDLISRFLDITAIAADAGYLAPQIPKMMMDQGIRPVLPYKRPMTKDGFFKKYEYVYDEHNDFYICPNNKELKYCTTNREGKKIYKSNSSDCEHCPYLAQCTHSQNHQKVVERHIWQEAMDEAMHLRHTEYNRSIYKQRSETIERVFADAKEKHGMRYTQYRGIDKVSDHAMLLFACMNLKKMANWKWKRAA